MGAGPHTGPDRLRRARSQVNINGSDWPPQYSLQHSVRWLAQWGDRHRQGVIAALGVLAGLGGER